MSYLAEKLFPGNPFEPWSPEWQRFNHERHVRRLDTDPEYARDYAEGCRRDNYLSDIAERGHDSRREYVAGDEDDDRDIAF